jgi:DNA-binding phage protein
LYKNSNQLTVAARGQYLTAFKLKAIKRVEYGEGVLPVARDLGLTRKALHSALGYRAPLEFETAFAQTKRYWT